METGLASLAAATVLFALNAVEKSFNKCMTFFMLSRKTYRMGFLRIPGYICI